MEIQPERRLTRSATRLKQTESRLNVSEHKRSTSQGRSPSSGASPCFQAPCARVKSAKRATRRNSKKSPDHSLSDTETVGKKLEIPVQGNVAPSSSVNQITRKKPLRGSVPEFGSQIMCPLTVKNTAPSKLPVPAISHPVKASRKRCSSFQETTVNKHTKGLETVKTENKVHTCITENMEGKGDYEEKDVEADLPTPRKHNLKNDSAELVEEPVTAEVHDRRKSKRRSSFIRGRISQPQMPTARSDICKIIPLDLQPEERLARLGMDALEYTLNKLSEEFSDPAGMQQFQVEARDAVGKKFDEMRRNGLLKRATYKERYAPNPVNIALDAAIAKAQADRDRYLAESDEWDSMLDDRSRLAEEAENAFENVVNMPVTDYPQSLSAEQKMLLGNQPNLISVLDLVGKLRDKSRLMTLEMDKSMKLATVFQECANTVIREQVDLLQAQSFQGIPDFSQPRALIENLLDPSTKT